MNRKSGVSRRVIPVMVLVLCLSLFLSLLRSQASISAKQQELASVQAELDSQLAQNEELQRTLDDGEDAIIERMAREQGYARPNERVFYDIGGN